MVVDLLLDNKYTVIPSIRFSLTYDNGVRTVITVKTRDKVDCSYKKNGERFNIVGVVTKIGCNFNSSLGTVGTTAYLQIDGSSEYEGQVEYIQPEQVLAMSILSSAEVIDNVVCSVDNEDQRISLVRENEAGVFQYSLDGISWRAATGAQGMSAYECAVALGFQGTEQEWLDSLQGKDGEPGPAGALEIYKVYNTMDEAWADRHAIPVGKLIAIINVDITPGNNTKLWVRKDCSCGCGCSDCDCGCTSEDFEEWYTYVGYLTLGPAGRQGEPGKSAYETAVDGGYPGTEEEFTKRLANNDVAVTNSYMGQATKLENTIMGPMDLRIYGFTDHRMVSKNLRHIDVSCSTEVDDQTVIFPDEIVLRAVPTERASAKPNITINGKKYVADVVMNKAGVVGVYRRVEYIDNYNGEAIMGDWMSSTGELDMGAKVQYTVNGYFEPFDDTVQSQYKKLHTYDGDTRIDVSEAMYMSVTFPINLTTFINASIESKQDTLVAGENITIDTDTNKISAKGAVFDDSFITTQKIGGLPTGTEIHKGDSISAILQKMLCPYVPVEDRCVFWGNLDHVPTDLTGLEKEPMDDETLLQGVQHAFDLNNQYPVFAYKKSNGPLKSIRDETGFENIRGWNVFEYLDIPSDIEYYVYYSEEPLTIGLDYVFTFLFK